MRARAISKHMIIITGVIVLPTQTMHHKGEIPSQTYHTFAMKFDPSQMGCSMIPVLFMVLCKALVLKRNSVETPPLVCHSNSTSTGPKAHRGRIAGGVQLLAYRRNHRVLIVKALAFDLLGGFNQPI